MNRQAAAAAAATAIVTASTTASTTTTTTSIAMSSDQQPKSIDPLASVQQAGRRTTATQLHLSQGTRYPSPTVYQPQSQPIRQSSAPITNKGLQLHNLRPMGTVSEASTGSALTTITSLNSSSNATTTIHHTGGSLTAPQTAQMTANKAQAAAVDLVQSAAAKFKMLRSNTLAAASWISGTSGGVDTSTTAGLTSNESFAQTGGPSDLLAMKTKDDRIVQTLSIGSSARTRPE